MTLEELSSLASKIEGEIYPQVKGIVLPLAIVAISAVSAVKRSSLVATGLRPSSTEDSRKSLALALSIVEKYMGVVVMAIGVVIATQQLKELSRDKYTPEYGAEQIKSDLKPILENYLSTINIGKGRGVKAKFFDEVKKKLTGPIVELVLGAI